LELHCNFLVLTMSFGFSLGDIVALVTLTKNTYYGWRQAPIEYEDVVQTLKEGKELICHVQRRFETLTTNDINSGKPKEIGDLLQGCRNTISDLREVARRRRKLGHWDRLRLGASHISNCKNRLAHHITILTPLLFSLELGSIGKDVSSLQATLDRLPQVLSNVLPVALGKMIDTRTEDSRTARRSSIMTTYGDDDDKQAYKDLRKHLMSCGIKDSVVRQHQTKLVEFAKSLTHDQNNTVGDVTGGQYQMTEASNVLGPLPRSNPRVASNVENPKTALQNITAKRLAYQVYVKTDSEDGDTTSVIPSPTNGNTVERHANSVPAHRSSEDHAHVIIDDGDTYSAVGSCDESDDSCCDEARYAYSSDGSDCSNAGEQPTSSRPSFPARSPRPPRPPAPARSPSVPTAGGQSIGSGALQPINRSSYTLTNGSSHSLSRDESHIGRSSGARITIQDNRFEFQPDEVLPMPRQFDGGPRRYRAGRGSNIPLDLSAFE
jgi:hypothetical protein